MATGRGLECPSKSEPLPVFKLPAQLSTDCQRSFLKIEDRASHERLVFHRKMESLDSPSPPRNPSPPRRADADTSDESLAFISEQVQVDCIGSTTLSKRWALSLLLDLVKATTAVPGDESAAVLSPTAMRVAEVELQPDEEDQPLDPDLEVRLCQLWDASAEEVRGRVLWPEDEACAAYKLGKETFIVEK